MNAAPEIAAYAESFPLQEKEICDVLAKEILEGLPDATSKIWHGHPVWFLDENPIAGYSKIKSGIRLMFWSGADFQNPGLQLGTGKFKDASITYTTPDQLDKDALKQWLEESKTIQWDYKNLVKRKGKLERLK